MAIVRNAKLRRTSICGAAETLLVDRASPLHRDLVMMMLDAGCEIRGDAATARIDPRVVPATKGDWAAEYLDAILAVKLVDGIEEAIGHIERYGTHHTDCIVTESQAAADRFLLEVDSAIVMHNASTQFADGGEFGFGGEIGIATGRLHARGPVGVDQLATFKYRVHGKRPDPTLSPRSSASSRRGCPRRAIRACHRWRGVSASVSSAAASTRRTRGIAPPA